MLKFYNYPAIIYALKPDNVFAALSQKTMKQIAIVNGSVMLMGGGGGGGEYFLENITPGGFFSRWGRFVAK